MTVEYVNSEKKMKNKTQKTEIKATREKAICQIKKKKKSPYTLRITKSSTHLRPARGGRPPSRSADVYDRLDFTSFQNFCKFSTPPLPPQTQTERYTHTHSHWNTHTVESFDVETKRIVGLATGGGGVGNVTAVLRVSRSPNLGQFTRFGPKWQNACETYVVVVVVAYSVRFPTSSKNLNGKQKVLNLKRKTRNIREKKQMIVIRFNFLISVDTNNGKPGQREDDLTNINVYILKINKNKNL